MIQWVCQHSQELKVRAVVSVAVPCHNLLDGDVRPRHKAHKANEADADVLDHHPELHIFIMEGDDLKQGWNDEGQSAATHGAHQRDDEVKLRDQYGENTCGKTAKGTSC